jgi:hypothetical protein
MPYPPPPTFQLLLCCGVALSNVGYQAKGTVMVRPSFMVTLRVSLVNATSVTLSSAPSAKIPTPCLQQLVLMLGYDSLEHSELSGIKAKIAR